MSKDALLREVAGEARGDDAAGRAAADDDVVEGLGGRRGESLSGHCVVFVLLSFLGLFDEARIAIEFLFYYSLSQGSLAWTRCLLRVVTPRMRTPR